MPQRAQIIVGSVDTQASYLISSNMYEPGLGLSIQHLREHSPHEGLRVLPQRTQHGRRARSLAQVAELGVLQYELHVANGLDQLDLTNGVGSLVTPLFRRRNRIEKMKRT